MKTHQLRHYAVNCAAGATTSVAAAKIVSNGGCGYNYNYNWIPPVKAAKTWRDRTRRLMKIIPFGIICQQETLKQQKQTSSTRQKKKKKKGHLTQFMNFSYKDSPSRYFGV